MKHIAVLAISSVFALVIGMISYGVETGLILGLISEALDLRGEWKIVYFAAAALITVFILNVLFRGLVPWQAALIITVISLTLFFLGQILGRKRVPSV